jgi:hypothetical protein
MPKVSARPTPNPDSLKFTTDGARFIASGLRAYRTPAEAEGDPLGAALLAVGGVADVLILPDFVTVTKHPAAGWDDLLPAVERILQAHAVSTGAE